MPIYKVRPKGSGPWHDIEAENIITAKMEFCKKYKMVYAHAAPMIEVAFTESTEEVQDDDR